jgi:hypothetical protein
MASSSSLDPQNLRRPDCARLFVDCHFSDPRHVWEAASPVRRNVRLVLHIPQHSDARVLEQVIYKWSNTRRTLTRILPDTYRLLLEDGRDVTHDDIQRDITRLFRSNAEAWMGLHSPGSDAPTET